MRKLLSSLSMALLWATFAFAQERTVTGTVTASEDGTTLPGVSIQIKGTTTGTQTGPNGQYSIRISGDNVILVFSYIGFASQEINAGTRDVVNVALSTDATQLGEVVVVGYSTTTKQAFTGTAKTVSAENLDKKNVSNVSQALAGEVSGVRVINNSGQPGSEATIRIRGLGSVNGSRDPLYVVDGVPFNGSLNSINPADIASATILKDAAATAIYGSRGANGVVVITTNSGKGQESFIEVDANLGTNMALLPRYNTIKSPEQFIGLAWESLYNRGVALGNANPTNYANARLFSSAGIAPGYNLWNAANAAALIDPATHQVREGITRKYDPEDWEDYAFQNSARNEVNVKFGGSSGKTNYYSSVGYLKDNGYIVNSDYKRLSARLNLSQEIKSWLNASVNFGYGRSETNNNGQSEDSGSIFWFVDNMPSIYPLFMRDANGQFVEDPIFGGNQYDYGTNYARGFGALTNAIADATYDILRNKRDELNGSANLNFKFLKDFVFENRFGAQYFADNYVNRGNKYYGSSASQNGSIYTERTGLASYNLLNLLRYTKDFGQHNIEALAAHEATSWSENFSTVSGYNLVDPNSTEIGNAVVFNPSSGYNNKYTLESYFAQVNYDYNSKYYLSATIRRDGSSRFRKDKWGTFGSVGAAWLISSEDFMSSQNIFNSLKLKASYGLIGDQAGVGYYPGYDKYDVDNLNDNPAFSFDTKGNPDLTWETSKMFQTGVEFTVGKYLTGAIDYYVKNTDDLIFERRVGPSLGYAFLLVNGGKLRNNGLEFDLTGHILQNKDYRLNLNLNGEIFNNKITEMPIDPVTGQQKPIDVQAPFGWSVGHSVYDFYMREFAGVNAETGTSMWTQLYNDANNNGASDDGEEVTNLVDYLSKNPTLQESNLKSTTTSSYALATQKYTGKSAIPDIRGAVNLSGGYKGLDLSVQMLYSFGGYAYDYVYATLMDNPQIGTNNWHTDILNRWQKTGDVTSVPRINNNTDQNVASSSTRFLTKANYLALNNIRLGYTVPSSFTKKYGVNGLSLWVSGDNLWIHTNRKGFNPAISEAGSSNETDNQTRYQYSPLSTITAGLRVKL